MAEKIEFEESLIDLVRQYPCLYLKKDDGYKNKTVRENAWLAISAMVGKTAEDCFSTWKSIRGQYMAFLRKIDHPTGTGATARPYFRHEASMAFCREVTGSTTSYSNVSSVSSQSASTIVDQELADSEGADELHYEFELSPGPGPSTPSPVPIRVEPTRRVHAKYASKRKMDPVDAELMKALKDDDEWDLFGSSLSHKLRKLDKTAGLGTDAQIEILKIVRRFENESRGSVNQETGLGFLN